MQEHNSLSRSTTIFPTTLLEISDHINRVHLADQNVFKVVGILFGSHNGSVTEITSAAELSYSMISKNSNDSNSNNNFNGPLNQEFLSCIVEQNLMISQGSAVVGWYGIFEKMGDELIFTINDQISKLGADPIFLTVGLSALSEIIPINQEQSNDLQKEKEKEKEKGDKSSLVTKPHLLCAYSVNKTRKILEPVQTVVSVSSADFAVLAQLSSISSTSQDPTTDTTNGSSIGSGYSSMLNTIDTQLAAIKTLKDNLTVLSQFVQEKAIGTSGTLDPLDESIIQKVNEICVNTPNLSNLSANNNTKNNLKAQPSTDKLIDSLVLEMLSSSTAEIMGLASKTKSR